MSLTLPMPVAAFNNVLQAMVHGELDGGVGYQLVIVKFLFTQPR